jgi:MoaA/NifB/PqqE/SkfB family radical SAM enzyme
MKRYIDCTVPTTACNLRCSYCYIIQRKKKQNQEDYKSQIGQFPYFPVMREALSVKRLGGKCLFHITAGGETLISDTIIPVIQLLLEEGHYVMIVTNLTVTPVIDELLKLPEFLLKRLAFKVSFHFLELKRTGKLDEFFSNIHRVRGAGCSFTLELTPSDELVEYIDEIKKACMENLGSLCHVTIARVPRNIDKKIPILSSYSFEQYKAIWGVFNSAMFDLKIEDFYKRKKEFCYAGEWAFHLNLSSGNIMQCCDTLSLQNIYKDPESPIKYLPVGNKCSIAHCYNSHVYLPLGVLPELAAPDYSVIRNRAGVWGGGG